MAPAGGAYAVRTLSHPLTRRAIGEHPTLPLQADLRAEGMFRHGSVTLPAGRLQPEGDLGRTLRRCQPPAQAVAAGVGGKVQSDMRAACEAPREGRHPVGWLGIEEQRGRKAPVLEIVRVMRDQGTARQLERETEIRVHPGEPTPEFYPKAGLGIPAILILLRHTGFRFSQLTSGRSSRGWWRARAVPGHAPGEVL